MIMFPPNLPSSMDWRVATTEQPQYTRTANFNGVIAAPRGQMDREKAATSQNPHIYKALSVIRCHKKVGPATGALSALVRGLRTFLTSVFATSRDLKLWLMPRCEIFTSDVAAPATLIRSKECTSNRSGTVFAILVNVVYKR